MLLNESYYIQDAQGNRGNSSPAQPTLGFWSGATVSVQADCRHTDRDTTQTVNDLHQMLPVRQ